MIKTKRASVKFLAVCTVLIIFSACSSMAASGTDPLFAKLDGNWVGVGSRTYLVSNRVIELFVEKRFYLESDRLLVRTHIMQSPHLADPTEPSETISLNWIKGFTSNDSVSEYLYGVGSGESPSEPTAHGWYDGKAFELLEPLDQESGYWNHSWYQIISEDTIDWHNEIKQKNDVVVEGFVRFLRVQNE